jgi:hypothetical protein
MQAHSDIADARGRPVGLTHTRQGLWLGIIVLLLVSVTVRVIDLDRLPVTDELYTTLAAQGWLHEGEPRIAEGLYTRAQFYTLLLGGWLGAFGEDVVAARTFSLVAGVLLVVAVFAWTRSVAGNLAGWIAGLFVALDPLSVQISQFARFYAMHALVFWLAAIAVYALVAGRVPPRARIWVALASVLGFLFAAHLQILTLFGVVGLGLWLFLAVGVPWLRGLGRQKRGVVLLGVAGLIVIAGAAMLLTGMAEELLQRYRWSPSWNRAHRNEFWFYQVFFVERYPTFWSLTPLALLLAVIHRPRPAIFCACIFVPSFALLSFGGMKDDRYLFFALPFLFILWAMALAKAFDYLYPWLQNATDRVLRRLAPYLPNRPIRMGLIAAGVVFLIASNGGVVKGLMLLSGAHLVAAEGGVGMVDRLERTNWEIVKPFLQPKLAQASIVLTSRDMHHLYYLEDYDFVVSENRLSEIDGDEFTIDPRTGLPVVSTVDSVRTIMECYPDGVIVIENGHWRSPIAVNDEIADLLERVGQPVAELPPESQIKAFEWRRSGEIQPEQCASLPPGRTGAGGEPARDG